MSSFKFTDRELSFACINELSFQSELEVTKLLSLADLKVRASLWLFLNNPDNFLMRLKRSPELFNNQLLDSFNQSDYLQSKDFLETDLNQAWKQAFTEHIENQKHREGLQGFKIGDRLVQSTPKSSFKSDFKVDHNSYEYRLGQIIDIDISLQQIYPIIVIWKDNDIWEHYSCYILQKEHISKILPVVQLSQQVSYEVSEEGRYYRAFVGFNSKKIARSWWRELKRELGYLNELIQFPSEQRPTPQKYHYIASNPKQKTLNSRLKHLSIVAHWDLVNPRR